MKLLIDYGTMDKKFFLLSYCIVQVKKLYLLFVNDLQMYHEYEKKNRICMITIC